MRLFSIATGSASLLSFMIALQEIWQAHPKTAAGFFLAFALFTAGFVWFHPLKKKSDVTAKPIVPTWSDVFEQNGREVFRGSGTYRRRVNFPVPFIRPPNVAVFPAFRHDRQIQTLNSDRVSTRGFRLSVSLNEEAVVEWSATGQATRRASTSTSVSSSSANQTS
jgi:hypothetical protein